MSVCFQHGSMLGPQVMKGPGSGIPGRWREQQLHFFPPDFGPVDYAAGMILMKAGALMSPGWVMMLENLDKGWVGLGLWTNVKGWAQDGLVCWRMKGAWDFWVIPSQGDRSEPFPTYGKMGSPLHLATLFMGDHHGLTPNRLLSVFYVLFPVCVFGR